MTQDHEMTEVDAEIVRRMELTKEHWAAFLDWRAGAGGKASIHEQVLYAKCLKEGRTEDFGAVLTLDRLARTLWDKTTGLPQEDFDRIINVEWRDRMIDLAVLCLGIVRCTDEELRTAATSAPVDETPAPSALFGATPAEGLGLTTCKRL